MSVFLVRQCLKGIGNSPVAPFGKVEGVDELDAATHLLQIPLQREPRPDLYIRAFVRRLDRSGAPIKLYAAIG